MTARAREPADVQHYLTIDRQLFDRLHCGSLAPLEVALKDGGTVTGQPKSIIRGNDLDNGRVAYWGRLLLVTETGEIEVDYTTIAAIAG